MRAVTIVATACVTIVGHCFAQTVTPAKSRVETTIPPQALGRALKEFARSRHMQVLYLTAEVKNVRTRGASGDLTSDEVLARLLRGTGLSYQYVDNTAVSIVASRSKEAAKGQSASLQLPTKRRTHTIKDDSSGTGSKGTGPPKEQASSTVSSNRSQRNDLDEVVITGSRLPTAQGEGPQEVQVYDSVQIQQSGQNSVADFLNSLPSASVQGLGAAFGVAPAVQLRGLPVGTTLVLVNGRRLEGSGAAQVFGGGNYFDLSNIPVEMVQRVEVDENGASAIYGSDAIAGVVNIILKKDFNGFAVDAKYNWAKDFGQVRTDIAYGRQWSRAGLEIMATYGTNTGLLNSDRFLSENNDYTSFGGPDNNYPVCSPGNVFSADGTPLPGAPPGSGATYAAVANTVESGKPAYSQFAYGSLNQCSVILGTSLLPSEHRAGVFLQGHLEVSPSTELFTELLYTHASQVEMSGYESLFGFLGYQQFSVSAANPYNPFDTTVGVTEALTGAPVANDINTDFFRPLVGIKGSLARRWQWELSVFQSTDWTHDIQPNMFPNYGAIQNALDSPDPSTALNPFVDGPIAPVESLRSFFTDGNVKYAGQDRSAQGFIRGPILRLPAGDAWAVVGGDYVRSTFHGNDIYNGVNPPGTQFAYAQHYYAAFAQARIPLLARHTKLGRRSLFDFTVAGRRDEYSTFGGATTYNVGVEMTPIDGLLMRGAYADAFQAPSLTALYSPQGEAIGVVTDPQTGSPANVEVVGGGNPRLHPLTGRSHTFGLVYSGRVVPGLRVGVTQWKVVENNNVQILPDQLVVNNPGLFPGDVIRNTAGAIVEVLDTNQNFGTIDVAGIDYQVAYQHGAGRGDITVDLDGTDTYHYREALVPGAPAVEAVSQAEDDGDWAPRWKATLGVGWKEGSLSTWLDGRYTGSYFDYDSTRGIGKFWLVDANMRWNFASAAEVLRGVYVEAGCNNLFNRGPQFSNFDSDFFGYDAAETSIVGRSVYVGIGAHW